MPFVQPDGHWLHRPLTLHAFPYSPAPGPVSPLQETSVIPSAFEYHAPTSLPDAIALLDRFGDEAKLLAGGPQPAADDEAALAAARPPDRPGPHPRPPGHLRSRKRNPHRRHDHRERAGVVRSCWPTRCRCWSRGARWIADPQVRYRGTVGGDISHGDPANDHPALMLALDASFVLRGPRGERVVKAADFFQGLYATGTAGGRGAHPHPGPDPAARHRLGLREAQAKDRRLRHGGGRRAARPGRGPRWPGSASP
jgi:carbon-monoxide dehydrogenase medium subunit